MCEDDPGLKEYLGCDEPTQIAVWGDEEDQFHTCPRKFLTHEAVDWFENYKYNIDFQGSSPKFGDQSERFLLAMKYFNTQVSRIANSMSNRKQNDKTTDTLRTMRMNFKKE